MGLSEGKVETVYTRGADARGGVGVFRTGDREECGEVLLNFMKVETRENSGPRIGDSGRGEVRGVRYVLIKVKVTSHDKEVVKRKREGRILEDVGELTISGRGVSREQSEVEEGEDVGRGAVGKEYQESMARERGGKGVDGGVTKVAKVGIGDTCSDARCVVRGIERSVIRVIREEETMGICVERGCASVLVRCELGLLPKADIIGADKIFNTGRFEATVRGVLRGRGDVVGHNGREESRCWEASVGRANGVVSMR